MIDEIRVGDMLYTRYHSKSVTKISDTKVWNERSGYLIEDFRKLKVNLLSCKLSYFLKRLEKYQKEYPYLICDLHNNIAVSDIPKADFKRHSDFKKWEHYQKYYDEHVKFLFHSKSYKEKEDPLVGEDLLPTEIDEFFSTIGLFLWQTPITYDIGNLVSCIQDINPTLSSEETYIYKDTKFIKSDD